MSAHERAVASGAAQMRALLEGGTLLGHPVDMTNIEEVLAACWFARELAEIHGRLDVYRLHREIGCR